jgi:hypothetical protein
MLVSLECAIKGHANHGTSNRKSAYAGLAPEGPCGGHLGMFLQFAAGKIQGFKHFGHSSTESIS